MKTLFSALLAGTLTCLLFISVSAQESNRPEDNLPEPVESNRPEDNSPQSSFEFDMEALASIYDGAYERNVHLERVALDLPYIREADVMWAKRIWREIDAKQKINRAFINEQMPLIKVLVEVLEQNPTAFAFYDEKFENPMTPHDLSQKLYGTDTIEVWDMDTDMYVNQVVNNDINLSAFNHFRLKEEWIFDTKTSTMQPRIIAIAPVRDVIDPTTGLVRGQEALFWVNYPNLRPYLAKYEALNEYNRAKTVSWTDVFDMRYFASVITKEENARDNRIEDVVAGRDAMLAAEEIKNEMMVFEHDLWSH